MYDYPVNRAGLAEAALVHVDGVTVSVPLLEALRSGLHDVPVVFQSTRWVGAGQSMLRTCRHSERSAAFNY